MLHSHTAVGRVLCFVVCLLLSVSAIIVGLMAFNINVMESHLVTTNLHMLVRPLQIAVGIAGILGLLHLLTGSGADKCMYCKTCKSCDTTSHNHHHGK